ncbi:MAG: aspartate kinase [Erysipelotrichaceae bacterium]
MLKVVKFGGSSLADARQFEKVKSIVEADDSRKFIVCSAPGKRYGSDNKITDLLYLCYEHVKYGVSYDAILDMIFERYKAIAHDLGLELNLEAEFELIESKLHKHMNVDYLVSRGEYLNGLLLANYLNRPFVDASTLLFFHYDGTINYEKSQKAMNAYLQEYPTMVIPGFYGSLDNGEIMILSRGGSDITGSIVARLVEASLYENFTDVNGILMADPRIIENPLRIESITHMELRELSYMGANVLHDETLQPIINRNIPIHILNTNAPQEKGTLILEDCEAVANKYPITGIAGKNDFTSMTIYKTQLSNEIGIIRKTLEIFEKYDLRIEHVATSIDSFSVIVETSDLKKVVYKVKNEIQICCNPDDIEIMDRIALIATVGRNMIDQGSISSKLFEILGAHEVKTRLIALDSAEINVIIGVDSQDYQRTIQAIYHGFIGG